jgi:hypothetical protein
MPTDVQRKRWTRRTLSDWLLGNRPELELYTVQAMKGYKPRDGNVARLCGTSWDDVAKKLGATR